MVRNGYGVGENARYKEAFDLRASGMTYQQVGQAMGGISGSRVRQLIAKYERLSRQQAVRPSSVNELPVRIRNVLVRSGYTDWRVVKAASDETLLRIRGLGVAGLAILRAAQNGEPE